MPLLLTSSVTSPETNRDRLGEENFRAVFRSAHCSLYSALCVIRDSHNAPVLLRIVESVWDASRLENTTVVFM